MVTAVPPARVLGGIPTYALMCLALGTCECENRP